MEAVRLGRTELRVTPIAYALDIGLSPEDLGQIDKIMSAAAPLGAPAPEGA